MVLKYASDANDPDYLRSIKVEGRLLLMIGPHPRIIETMGLAEDGLLLKYYPNGTLLDHIRKQPDETLERRLEWSNQLLDALAFVHSRNVVHCDICLRNIFLDDNFNIILADFQGLYVSSSSGMTLMDGMTREPPKSFMPRESVYGASVHTDLFAVGSTIYQLITGHEVFPELDGFDDEELITARFINEEFPPNNYVASHIVEKCWRGEYACAAEILVDIAAVQAVEQSMNFDEIDDEHVGDDEVRGKQEFADDEQDGEFEEDEMV